MWFGDGSWKGSWSRIRRAAKDFVEGKFLSLWAVSESGSAELFALRFHIRQLLAYTSEASTLNLFVTAPSVYTSCACATRSSGDQLSALKVCKMATQVLATAATNGVKANGKIKSKNQLRRLKAKQKKVEKQVRPYGVFLYSQVLKDGVCQTNGDSVAEVDQDVKMEDAPMDVEYVPEQLDVKGSALEEFSDVFARFQLPPEALSVRCALLVYNARTHATALIGSRPRALERRDHLLG